MVDQPKYKPLAASELFDDRQSARPIVPGTVAVGALRTDTPYFTGKSGGKLVDTLPVAVTKELLARGQQRFNIYCSPCHGQDGYGQGMIVRRGFRAPPSYHIDRLRNAPIGHFFDVMTNGFGVMPSYAVQVPVADRWAIAAYVRTLQFSQFAPVALAPPAVQQKLEGEKQGGQ
jgi:mono/diheme cytochrome c family protein